MYRAWLSACKDVSKRFINKMNTCQPTKVVVLITPQLYHLHINGACKHCTCAIIRCVIVYCNHCTGPNMPMSFVTHNDLYMSMVWKLANIFACMHASIFVWHQSVRNWHQMGVKSRRWTKYINKLLFWVIPQN